MPAARFPVILLVPILLGGACVSASAPSGPPAPAIPAAPALALSPCGDQPGVECGQLEVWEDRVAAAGRKISIFVKVIRATGANPAADPLFFFAGGPGGSVSDTPPQVFEDVLARRDVVLVDQRGTGKSHPLACTGWTKDTPEKMLALYLPPDAVAVCRDELSKIADLRHYTTANFVDDVNDVRAALGYQQINLNGGSYGTRPVQVFLRRHPQHARTAVLQGVTRMDEKYPLGAPFAAQQALDQLIQACAADPACRDAYGDTGTHLDTVLARFADGPLTVTSAGKTLTLHEEVMMEGLRHLMYRAWGTVTIPRILQRAAVEQDYAGLLDAIFQFEGAFAEGDGWYSGLWLSVSCSEDTPWITPEDLQRAEQTTRFGAYRPLRHVEACKQWPRGAIPDGFREPVRSDVPTLVLSGALDPATAPQSGDAVARYLPNSLHVVAREGHGPSDWQCTSKVMAAFLDSGTTQGLDTSCLGAIQLPPWPAKPVPLDPQVAETLVGSYAVAPGQQAPPGFQTLTVSLHDGSLIAQPADGPVFTLTPTGKTTFLLEQAGAGFDFRLGEDGSVEALVVDQGGMTLEFRPST